MEYIMPIPTHHVIKLVENHQIPYDPVIYRNIGAPPRYHAVCNCQWEAWTHELDQAVRWVMSHKQAQEMRGNTVEVTGLDITPKAEAAGNAEVIKAAAESVPEQPSKADVPTEEVKVEEKVDPVQNKQFHPEEELSGKKREYMGAPHPAKPARPVKPKKAEVRG